MVAGVLMGQSLEPRRLGTPRSECSMSDSEKEPHVQARWPPLTHGESDTRSDTDTLFLETEKKISK